MERLGDRIGWVTGEIGCLKRLADRGGLVTGDLV